jgi:Lar family restriction alleviation protein
MTSEQLHQRAMAGAFAREGDADAEADPCPFCGCGAIRSTATLPDSRGDLWYQMECLACKARGPMCRAVRVAVEHWNNGCGG